MKLQRFPKTPQSPTIMLHQLVEIVDEIEALTVSVTWKDGSMDSYWTHQTNYKLLAAARVAQLEADRVLLESSDD